MSIQGQKSPQQLHLESGTWIRTWRAARLIGVSPQTVRRYIERGFLTAKRGPLGGQYLISFDSIVTLIAMMEKEAIQPGSTTLHKV